MVERRQMMDTATQVWLVVLATLTQPAMAQIGGIDGFGSSIGFGGFGFAGDFYVREVIRRRTAHGILASLAILVLFPLGVIVLRLIPGKSWSVRVHIFIQLLGWMVFAAGFVLGLILLSMIPSFRLGFGGTLSLLYDDFTRVHPIIGIVVFIMILPQPVLGLVSHRKFRRNGKSGGIGFIHKWNGRVAILLGIVNGGLGLRLAGAPFLVNVTYIIVASFFGGIWLAVTVFSGFYRVFRRDRAKKKGGGFKGSPDDGYKGSPGDGYKGSPGDGMVPVVPAVPVLKKKKSRFVLPSLSSLTSSLPRRRRPETRRGMRSRTDTSRTGTSRAATSRAATSRAATSRADTSRTETSRTATSRTDTSRTDSRLTDSRLTDSRLTDSTRTYSRRDEKRRDGRRTDSRRERRREERRREERRREERRRDDKSRGYRSRGGTSEEGSAR